MGVAVICSSGKLRHELIIVIAAALVVVVVVVMVMVLLLLVVVVVSGALNLHTNTKIISISLDISSNMKFELNKIRVMKLKRFVTMVFDL